MPLVWFVRAAAALALGIVTADAAHAVQPAGEAAEALELPRPLLAHPPTGYAATPEGERWRRLESRGLAPRLAARPQGERRLEVEGEELAAPALRRARAEAAWRTLSGGGARRAAFTWSEISGAPHRVRAARLRVPERALDTRAAAEAAARAFVLANRELLLAGEAPADADLPLVKAHRVGDLWLLVFGQRHRGLEVIDGRVDLRLRRDGSVPLFGSQWFAGVEALASPLVQRPVAEAVARAAVGDVHGDVASESDLAILPVPAGDGFAYRLVHRVRHETAEPLGAWTTLVDAGDGTLWSRENAIRHYDLSGTVTAGILPAHPFEPFASRPLRWTIVRRAADSTLTDLSGDYLLPGVTAGEPVTTGLRGPYMEIFDNTGPEGLLTTLAPGGSPLDFHWNFAGGDTAEGNAYHHGLLAHDYIKGVEPGFTDMDYRMPCLVNINAACNAFWDGTGINFYRYGNGCSNTGNIADVVYHEYGHGRTQFNFFPFEPNGAMHEGFSDYLAASMTRQPVIGRGFFGPGTSIRTCDNTRALPAPECLGAVHCLGTAVSGALWDMQGNLAVSLGDSSAAQVLADQLWHFAGFGGAFWYQDYLLDLLLVDDNDGTLLNGTPHFTEICSAFEAHGYTCPDTTSGVWIVHAPLGDTDPSAVPFDVTAEMGSFAAPLAPGGQVLVFRVNGGPWIESALTPTGGDVHEGTLPALPSGGRADYYLAAEDQGALTATDPPGAPGAFHTFFVGTESVVFADDFETDQGWDANPGNTATNGYWRRVNPNGTSVSGFFFQTEDDHTPGPGVFCFVTGDTTAGFPPGLEDVDNGCVFLVSPRMQLAALTNARLEYWRWFTVETRFDDTLRIEVSGDDGVTWALLEQQDFTQNQWLVRSFDLGSRVALSDSVRLRVRVCDLGGGSLTEVALDDVVVTTRNFDPVDAPIVAAGLHLAQSVPNPTTGEALIAFGVPGGSGPAVPVRLRLYDARGRLVRTLVAGDRAPGAHQASWNGRDEAGRRVAPGTYLYRLDVAGERLSKKLVVTP